MRIPWSVAGLLAGIVAVIFLLPACSDSTGTIQWMVVVLSPLCGLFLGLVLDIELGRLPPN